MTDRYISGPADYADGDQHGGQPGLVPLLDQLLPPGHFYFQLQPASGDFAPGPAWRERFGYGDDCRTVRAWLDNIPVDQRTRLQDTLANLGSGVVHRYEGSVRMANAQGVAVDTDITLITMPADDEPPIVHGVQRLCGDAVNHGSSGPAMLHALANDLAGIAGFGELLKATRLSPAQQTYLEEMLTAARRSAEQISAEHSDLSADLPTQLGQMLGIDIVQSGPLDRCDFDAVSIAAIVGPLMQRRRNHAGDAAEVRLHLNAPPSSRGLPCATCRSPFRSQNFITISLRDNGAAIARDLVPVFFVPGFDTRMLHTSVDANPEDEVTEAVDHLHAAGGHATIRSRAEETAIDIYLPLPHPGRHRDKRESRATNRRILVVDDNPGVTGFIDTLLSNEGYDVVTTSAADDALSLFRESSAPFDLVISDVTLPGMSGQAMLKEMRRRDPFVGVVVCTGLTHIDGRQTDWRLLHKPLKRDTLLTVVSSLLDEP